MKNVSKHTLVFAFIAVTVVFLAYCRRDDQLLGVDTSNTSELVSQKATVAPTIDGTIDAMWANAPKLEVVPQVPNPGNGLFAGYVGKTYNVTLRSLYDTENVYFLVEWDDPTASLVDRPWYYNPTTKLWAREANSPVFDVNGLQVRDAFNEDKLGFLWNISTYDFPAKSCYASCHLNTPTIDPATGKTIPATSGNHYTNNVNEHIDQWHIHLMKDLVYDQGSDEYQDWNLGQINGNGRHADTQLATTDGVTTNTQNLKFSLNGKDTTVAVPKWVIPGGSNLLYIQASETVSGVAKKVMAVDSTGVLYYDGGTIDPRIGTDYQQVGKGDGPKVIPSALVAPMTGNRADLTVKATHTGSGWVMEIKRALKTPDTINQDVDFSTLDDQPFGIAVFNQANNQHAIKPGLLLKFQK